LEVTTGFTQTVAAAPEKLDNSISVVLVLDSAMAKDVKAKVTFSLLDKDREPMNSHSKTNEEYIFPMRGSNWGFKDFIKKADPEGSVHLTEDSFSMRCDVTILKDVHRFVAVPPSNLHASTSATS
jgi:speckle-type POZ protein